MSTLEFAITDWAAWAPGLVTAADWQCWAHGAERPEGEALPDVGFLPAMQRRRLSPLARMVCAVGAQLVAADESLPLVFASRHGEAGRTLDLLTDLAQGESLSPTAFGLSVHNAVPGLWSILRADRAEMTALAVVGDGLEQAVLEAVAMAEERQGPVLVIVAEDVLPEPYAFFATDVPFRHALALRLQPGRGWCLGLSPATEGTEAVLTAPALDWLRAVGRGDREWTRTAAGRQWRWERRDAA